MSDINKRYVADLEEAIRKQQAAQNRSKNTFMTNIRPTYMGTVPIIVSANLEERTEPSERE